MSVVKNVKMSCVLDFTKEVEYTKNAIISKTIVQDKQKSITLFSFDENEEISTHKTSGDAIVQILDGKAKIVIGSEEFEVQKEVEYTKNAIISKTIVQDKQKSITLFSFDENEEISTHKTSGDAIVQILDGKAKIVIGSEEFEVQKGQSIIMPSNVPHSVAAITKFKMLLMVVYKYE